MQKSIMHIYLNIRNHKYAPFKQPLYVITPPLSQAPPLTFHKFWTYRDLKLDGEGPIDNRPYNKLASPQKI